MRYALICAGVRSVATEPNAALLARVLPDQAFFDQTFGHEPGELSCGDRSAERGRLADHARRFAVGIQPQRFQERFAMFFVARLLLALLAFLRLLVGHVNTLRKRLRSRDHLDLPAPAAVVLSRPFIDVEAPQARVSRTAVRRLAEHLFPMVFHQRDRDLVRLVAADALRDPVDLAGIEGGPATVGVRLEERRLDFPQGHPHAAHRPRQFGQRAVPLAGGDHVRQGGRGRVTGRTGPPRAVCLRGAAVRRAVDPVEDLRQPPRRLREFVGRNIEFAPVDPTVRLPARQRRRGGDEQAAVGSRIDVRRDFALRVPPGAACRLPEHVAPASRRRQREGRAGQFTEPLRLVLQPLRFDVDVEDQQPLRGDANVRGRLLGPPALDLHRIGRGVLEPVGGRRELLPRRAREDGIAEFGIAQRRIEDDRAHQAWWSLAATVWRSISACAAPGGGRSSTRCPVASASSRMPRQARAWAK